MAKAHLTNVESEIRRLQGQKTQIEAEIQKLEEYMKNGLETLQQPTNMNV